MTSIKDKEILRKIAARYAEIVNSNDMAQRRKIWQKTNDLDERTVPFVIEDNGTFFADLMPACECEGNFERGLEAGLRRTICNYDNIPDDRIFHPFVGIGPVAGGTPICPQFEVHHVDDGHGRNVGFETNKPLADLEKGLDTLVPSEFSYNKKLTESRLEEAEKIFGDIIPVKIHSAGITAIAGPGMAQQAVKFMGMDNFYIAMMDQPENVHRMFQFFEDEALRCLDFLLKEGLSFPNNDADWVGSGSLGYTHELPRREMKEGDIWMPEDCWCFIEAQEAVGLSNEMFAEFIYPYMARVARDFGLIYYGCCEPVHTFWETLKDLKNLRKITISPWCDQEFMAGVLGKDVVMSRKPHPMQLCGENFKADEFTAHIKKTLDISKDNFVELIFRDTVTLSGAMKDRVAEACSIVKNLIGR